MALNTIILSYYLYLGPNASSLYDMHVMYIMVESIFGLNT